MSHPNYKKNSIIFILILCVIILVVLIFYLYISGNRGGISAFAQGGRGQKTGTTSTAKAVPGIFTETSTNASNLSYVQIGNANLEIQSYLSIVSDFGEWTDNSFIFGTKTYNQLSDMSDFTSYISQQNGNPATYILSHIHVIIGEDLSGDGEMLILSGVTATQGAPTQQQHVFVAASDIPSTNYVFCSDINYSFNTSDFSAGNTPFPQYNNAVNPLQISGDGVNIPLGTIPTNNLLSADTAWQFVGNYFGFSSDDINPSAYSFLIPQNLLLQYINAATQNNHKITALQFYLGQSQYDRLVLILVGIDANGNHIYVHNSNNNKNYVFEEFMPCPVCPVVGNSPYDVAYPNALKNQNSFILEPAPGK